MAAPQQHIRIVAILTMIAGALALIPALLMLLVSFGLMAGSAFSTERGLFAAGGITSIIGICLLVLGLPGIIAGYGLLARRRWARPLTLVLAIFHLFAFPFGTALAVYQFWVLFFNQDSVRAYEHESTVAPTYSRV